MVLDFCKSLSSQLRSDAVREAGVLMDSDGFRAPYEAYDNTTKYVLLLVYLHMS